jgi:ribonuclease E
MGLIVRTAGANRPKPEIKRDCEYLLRLWDEIRERTLASVAPALIYEEANLIKRAIRDGYSRDIDEVIVDGDEAWRAAREFMRMLMPTHARKVLLWRDSGQPLFAREHVEAQLDAMMSPAVQLRSGGYLVINQTEALVAIDVNSGRSTRERGIEETALRTNLEAADEVARQLRLRDLAGLIVIDFIDMEARRHNAMVERRIKDALKNDRARIQVGHISHFGLLEMSRQRLRPSLVETNFAACPHCGGTGHVRSTESAALHVLRAIEEEGAKRRAAEIVVHVAGSIALYILNHKRLRLAEIEQRTGMHVAFAADETLLAPQLRIERLRAQSPDAAPPAIRQDYAPMRDDYEPDTAADAAADEDAGEYEAADEAEAADKAEVTAPRHAAEDAQEPAQTESSERRRRRRRRRRGGRREESGAAAQDGTGGETAEDGAAGAEANGPAVPGMEAPALADGALETAPAETVPAADGDASERSRRRGRRGGRRRRDDGEVRPAPAPESEPVASYFGPTPADPFGGHAFDLFDAIDAVAEQAAANAAAAAPGVPEQALSDIAPPDRLTPEPAADEPAVAGEAHGPAPISAEADPLTIPEPPAPYQPVSAAPNGPEPDSEPEPAEPESAEPESPAPQGIRPVLVTAEAPPEERRRGWWRR